MQKHLRALCWLLIGCGSSSTLACDKVSITVTGIDENTLAANSIEWWYRGDEKNKKILTCEDSVCHSWMLPIAQAQSREIELVVIRNHDDDGSCADWFRGSIALSESSSEYTVKVLFAETVCK